MTLVKVNTARLTRVTFNLESIIEISENYKVQKSKMRILKEWKKCVCKNNQKLKRVIAKRIWAKTLLTSKSKDAKEVNWTKMRSKINVHV